MARLLNYFLKGLVLLAPLAITLFGFLASSFLTRRMLSIVEGMLERLPFVRLLYSSTRDLLNAFVGEKRRFDKPVVVALSPDGRAKVIGFATQESLDQLGLSGHVAVYLPQSYNFARNLLLFPAEQVQRLATESAAVMAFVISGGVTEMAS